MDPSSIYDSITVPSGLLTTFSLVQGCYTFDLFAAWLDDNFATEQSAHVVGDYESLAHRIYAGPCTDLFTLKPRSGSHIDELLEVVHGDVGETSLRFSAPASNAPTGEYARLRERVTSEAPHAGVSSHLTMAKFLMISYPLRSDFSALDLAVEAFDFYEPEWRRRFPKYRTASGGRFGRPLLGIGLLTLSALLFAAPAILVGLVGYWLSGWTAALLLPIPTAFVTIPWVAEIPKMRRTRSTSSKVGPGVFAVALLSAVIFGSFQLFSGDNPGEPAPVDDRGVAEVADAMCDGVAAGLSKDEIVEIAIAATGVSASEASGAYDVAMQTC